MKNFLFLLLMVCGLAQAQFDVGGGGAAAPTSKDTVMPAGQIFIDTTTIMARQFARSETRAKEAWLCAYGTAPCDYPGTTSFPNRLIGVFGGTGFANHNGGSFRVVCEPSHMGFDDPIVWPGQAGRTHLHQFFGNASTRSATDLANMATSGDSTCKGGTLNRSGYWSPVLIYHCPAGDFVLYGCTEARDGEVIRPTSSNFYYKVAQSIDSNLGGYGGTPVEWWPAGFRMIVGRAANTSAAGVPGSIECHRGGSVILALDHIPTTAEATAAGGCDEINMRLGFGECWEGSDIDGGPFHDEHVTAIDYYLGCPVNFPVFTPTITGNFHAAVDTADLDFIRLSSDIPRAAAVAQGLPDCAAVNNWCAGRSAHMDWVNGWSSTPNGRASSPYAWGGLTVTELLLKNCYMVLNPSATPVHSDCHNHGLGAPLETGIGDGTGQGVLSWWVIF